MSDIIVEEKILGGEDGEDGKEPLYVGGKRKSKKNAKKGGKTRKLNNGAKSWNSFVMEVFKKNRATNRKYTFVQALKEASKLRNKKNKSTKK